MEDELEKESIDQRLVRDKSRRSTWHLFLLMVLCVGFSQLFFEKLLGLFYLGTVIMYGAFLYETYMSRKSNEELWRLWEERWRERRTLFQVREAVSNSVGNLFPAIIGSNVSWTFFIVFMAIALGVGFRNGQKKWKAKEHYYQEYMEARGMAA